MSTQALPPELQHWTASRSTTHRALFSGVDRFDREMLRSVYHDDAMDDLTAPSSAPPTSIRSDTGRSHTTRSTSIITSTTCSTIAASSRATRRTPRRATGCSRARTRSGRRLRSVVVDTSIASRAKRQVGDPRPAGASSSGRRASTRCSCRRKTSMPMRLTGAALRDKNDVSYMCPLAVTRQKFVLPF